MSDSLNSKTTDRKRFADRQRRLLWRFRQLILTDLLINSLIGSVFVPRRLRKLVMRAWGAEVADSCDVYHGNTFSSNLVTFEEGSSATRCTFHNHARVTVGRNARIGLGACLITRTHELGPPERRIADSPTIDLPIVIEEGCWLASMVTVMPGVTIGKGCVVAAGAVVTRDCEPNGLYGGVPARRLRDLD